jgi:hypothetical protein
MSDAADVVLDKGMVIDAYMRVAPIGTEVLMVDARTVSTSLDAYVRFADAVNQVETPSGAQV